MTAIQLQKKRSFTLDIGHWALDIGHWTLDIGQLLTWDQKLRLLQKPVTGQQPLSDKSLTKK